MRETLEDILGQYQKRRIREPGRLCSAVLVPLFEQDGETWVLLAKRTETLRFHRGQIAFPGGAREAGDATPADNALREAEEEVGLKPEDVRIIGELDDTLTTTSNFTITPVVGLIPWPYDLKINPDEVSKALTVPLAALQDPANQRQTCEQVGEKEVPVTSYRYREHFIWGATARILTQLLGLADGVTGSGQPPTRPI